MTDIEQLCRDMFDKCKFCLVCGVELITTSRSMKRCRKGCGDVSVSDDMTGAPDALFVFSTKMYRRNR